MSLLALLSHFFPLHFFTKTIWILGSDDEDEGLSIAALRALGEALAQNQPLADLDLHGKQLTDEHLAAFVDGLAANQHLRIVGLGGLS